MSNQNIVLICGKSAAGKSASLRELRNQDSVVYLNTESNKALPFPNKFKTITVTDPATVLQAFTQAEQAPHIKTIVIDSLTFLMGLYESKYVQTAADSRKAWGEYASYFRTLMQEYVAKSTKNVIFLAHTSDVYNESELVNEVLVKVKGSLMNEGIEAWFTTVISAKKLPTKKLDGYANPNLKVTDDEEALGFKYVYQTRLTKDTVNERIRSPMGMWNVQETYIDNDLQAVLDKIEQYYKQGSGA